MTDIHLKVMQKVVERSVRISQSDDEDPTYTCLTCSADAMAPEEIPHTDKCPVGDLQRVLSEAGSIHTERNLRLANQRLNEALDNIHDLVKDGTHPDEHVSKAIINQVHEITKAFVEGT